MSIPSDRPVVTSATCLTHPVKVQPPPATKVKTVNVPAEANVPATYAQVAVKASKNLAGATDFMGFVTSPAGQAILAKYGFNPPS